MKYLIALLLFVTPFVAASELTINTYLSKAACTIQPAEPMSEAEWEQWSVMTVGIDGCYEFLEDGIVIPQAAGKVLRRESFQPNGDLIEGSSFLHGAGTWPLSFSHKLNTKLDHCWTIEHEGVRVSNTICRKFKKKDWK